MFDLNDLNIFPFSTPHDAVDPCGFNIFKDQKKISNKTSLKRSIMLIASITLHNIPEGSFLCNIAYNNIL